MPDLKWTDSEKKTARRVFEATLAEVMSEFKRKAAGVSMADEKIESICRMAAL